MWKVLFASLLMVLFIFGNGEMRKKAPESPSFQSEVVKDEKNITPETSLLKHEHKSTCNNTSSEPVQIICILDRSGSMANLAEDTIGGYNSFLHKQKENSGTAEVTTVLFDNQYEKIYEAVNIQDVQELTSEIYYVRGTTALLDALGMTITETFGRMERAGICPEKRRVLVMIMTDGLENASHEYDKKTVKNLIEKTTENYNWNYIFMGANMDSVKEASAIGISEKHAMDFAPTSAGISGTFERMSEYADDVRKNGVVNDKRKE